MGDQSEEPLFSPKDDEVDWRLVSQTAEKVKEVINNGPNAQARALEIEKLYDEAVSTQPFFICRALLQPSTDLRVRVVRNRFGGM